MRAHQIILPLLAAGCFDFAQFDQLPGDGAAPTDAPAAVDGGAPARDAAGGGDLAHAPAWAPVASPVAVTLNAVWGADAQHLFAVGAGGVFLRSDDGGANWTASLIGGGNALRAVWGWSASDLLVGGDGGTLLRTSDGGAHWNPVLLQTQMALVSLTGTGAKDTWAVGTNAILHTSDGANWQLVGGGPPGTWNAAWAPAPQALVVAQPSGSIDADYGGTWYITNCALAGDLLAVAGASATDVWAVGAAGAACHAADPRNLWTLVPTGAQAALRGVWVAADGAVHVVGDGGTILRSDDGANFTAEASGTTVALRGVWGSDATHLWAVGDGGTILHYE